MLVFDIGANIGAKAAAMRDKGARVVCFEPQPACAEELRKRFSGDPDVQVVQTALGAARGKARMSLCPAAPTVSTMSETWKTGRFRDMVWNEEIEVPVETLDWAISQYGMPDYCKIDVEGFEYDVLQGLSTALPLLSFEFTKEFTDRAADCLHVLEQCGFHLFNVSYGETGRFRFDQWLDGTALLDSIAQVRSPLAWGDIYAAMVEPSSDLLALVTTGAGDEDTLAALRRAGHAYPGVPLRLHLGCGATLLENYVNIDYPQERHNVMQVRPELETDITALRFPSDSVDEIRLHHVFEHFSRVVALGLLVRWHGWLRTGGRLLIETPDLMATAAEALRMRGAARMGLLRHLEGDQAADWAYHVGQWFPERFERTFTALGFAEICIEQSSTGHWHRVPLHNVTAYATKREALSSEILIERAEALLWESTVADGERPTWEIWCRQLRAFLAEGRLPPQPVAHAPLRG